MTSPPLISPEYDLIVFGGGCAGLSLLTRLSRAGWTKNRKVLLVERDASKSNDRTWCFWEKAAGFFEDIVYRKWQVLSYHGSGFSGQLAIEPYTYKLIRGEDFYQYCNHQLKEDPAIDWLTGNAENIVVDGHAVHFLLNKSPIHIRAGLVFNTIFQPGEDKGELKLLQHFKGWVVETDHPAFDASHATFMDFRVPQDGGTAFVYVLPFTNSKALVEYTVFSREILETGGYEAGLKNYLEEICGLRDYRIESEEFGVIPMTSHRFDFSRNGMHYLGTAGGQTKGSSGFTFQFIQKQVAAIVDCLARGASLESLRRTPRRFRFYDNTLLHILYHNKVPGERVFTSLFRKNKAKDILAFLDNESNFPQEFKIISTLPTWPFLKAAVRQMGK